MGDTHCTLNCWPFVMHKLTIKQTIKYADNILLLFKVVQNMFFPHQQEKEIVKEHSEMYT